MPDSAIVAFDDIRCAREERERERMLQSREHSIAAMERMSRQADEWEVQASELEAQAQALRGRVAMTRVVVDAVWEGLRAVADFHQE